MSKLHFSINIPGHMSGSPYILRCEMSNKPSLEEDINIFLNLPVNLKVKN
jgi:hypothetical protein